MTMNTKNTKKTVVTAQTTSAAVAPVVTPAPAASPPVTAITGPANGGNHGTKVDLQTAYQSLATGLVALFLPTDTFLFKAGTFTRDELVTEVQKFIAAAEVTKAANQTWRTAVQEERTIELEVRPLRQGVRRLAQNKFGPDGAQLLQLGFNPTKPVKKTVKVKAEAVAKTLATRTARGIKGSKQRKAIKAPPAPAPGPTPVASGTAPAGTTPAGHTSGS